MYNTSEQMSQDYKRRFKEILREQVGQLDKDIEDKCAEVAWQSCGWQTLQIISSRIQQNTTVSFQRS